VSRDVIGHVTVRWRPI